MGRGAGYGTGLNTVRWEKQTTPGGLTYWTRKDDPGWGYLDDPSKEGLQPAQALRYPTAYIDYVLGPAPNDPGTTRRTRVGQQTRELMATGLQGRICVPYGRVKVSGALLAWRALNAVLVESFGVSHGPIHQFVGVEMLDQTASLVGGAPFHDAALFQTEKGIPNPLGAVPGYYLSATSNQGVERFPYLATAHGRFIIGKNGVNQAPTPLFIIDGRTLRDPRLGMTDGIPNQPEVFNKNPACAIADYISSRIYGPGRPDERFYWDTVAEAAEYYDVLIAGLKRSTINWAIMQKSPSHRDVIETMKMACRLVIYRRDGKLVFAPKKNVARAGGYVFTPANSQPVSAEPTALSTAPNTIRVTFTNPLKDYSEDSVVARTEAARTGAEPTYNEEFHFECLDNAAEAQRIADALLAERRNPMQQVVWLGTKAEARQFEPTDRVGYYSPTARLGTSEADPEDLRIQKVEIRADGTVQFFGEKYLEIADSTRDTEPPPINTTPPPTEAPAAATSPAGAAVLTVGDGLTELADGRIIVDWTHPGWPYSLRYRVTAQGIDAETEIADVPGGPIYFDASDVTTTVRIYAYIPATGATSVALATVIAFTAPPNPLNIDTTQLPDWVWWDAPPRHTSELWGAAAWSGVGLTSLTPANVNNGGTGPLAAEFDTSGFGATSYLRLDTTTGRRFRRLSVWCPSAETSLMPSLTVEYSADGVTYFAVSGTGVSSYGSVPFISAQQVNRVDLTWNDPGSSPRYWRIAFQNVEFLPCRLSEAQFYEFGASYPFVKAYRIYDYTSGALLKEVPQPTSTAPVNVAAYLRRLSNWSYQMLLVRTVNTVGLESDGIYIGGGEDAGYDHRFAELEAAQTLTNKTIDATDNTIAISSTHLSDSADLARLASPQFTGTPSVNGPYSTASWTVTGAPVNATTERFQMVVRDSRSFAQDVGGGIALQGRYLSGSSAYATLAIVRAGKENATSGDFSAYLAFHTTTTGAGSSAERMRITSVGNVGVRGTSFGGGVGVQFFGNATTLPSSNPTGGVITYADAGALKARGTSGTVTTIAPAEPHCPVCRGDVAVIESVNHEAGYFFLCLRCMVRDLKLDGKPYVIVDEDPEKRPTRRDGPDLEAAVAAARSAARAARERSRHTEEPETQPESDDA